MKRILLLFSILALVVWGLPAHAAQSPAGPLTVDQAVAVALAENPAMTAAEENLRAAEAGVQSARAGFLPEASLSYGYTGLKEIPVMKLNGADYQTAHRDLYNWKATVVQPLFTGFALSSRFDMANLDVASRRLEKDQTILDLTRQVKSAGFNLLLQQRLLAVGDQEVAAYTAHRRDAELFYREGLIRPNDLLQAQVALANAIQQREKVDADVQKARVALNRLLNLPLDGDLVIADVELHKLLVPCHDLAALSDQALADRPLIQLLDVSLSQLNQTLRLAKSAWYPTVSLTGQYAQEGDNWEADENAHTNTYNAVVGLQAQWTFFEGGKTLAETARVKRQIRSLEAGIAGYRNQVLQEVRNAVLDCEVARKNIDTAARALDQARENWRITDLQYKQQLATSTDVLDARSFLTQADTNYFRAVYGYGAALAGLDRAVGKRLSMEGKDKAEPPMDRNVPR